MSTPHSGPPARAAGPKVAYFHVAYTFLSVGIFLVFSMETWKTMHATYEDAMNKLARRKANKAAARAAAAGGHSEP